VPQAQSMQTAPAPAYVAPAQTVAPAAPAETMAPVRPPRRDRN
jgi:hypothetical protein